jgi:hypothetical protein
MRIVQVPLGKERSDGDGCRRYRPIEIGFDTRPHILTMEIGEDWEPEVAAQWRHTQSSIRMSVLAEHGTINGDDKIANFTAMGPAPWSIVFEHNTLLKQVRSAFIHGDFYPALVGACALGERILNELIISLRADYVNHKKTTARVRRGETFSDWNAPIEVLHGWGVLTDELEAKYQQLQQQRHESVHFKPGVDVAAREPALAALKLLQEIIEGIFVPHGGPPRYIENISGGDFFSLEAEQEPLIKRIFLPRSALLSPAHRFNIRPDGGEVVWEAFDDADYDPTPLTDAEFAAALPAGVASVHPEFQQPDSQKDATTATSRNEP